MMRPPSSEVAKILTQYMYGVTGSKTFDTLRFLVFVSFLGSSPRLTTLAFFFAFYMPYHLAVLLRRYFNPLPS